MERGKGAVVLALIQTMVCSSLLLKTMSEVCSLYHENSYQLQLMRKCLLGLFVRPPRQDEQFANWEKTSAGLRENDAGWVYVPPTAGTFTVFPGMHLNTLLQMILAHIFFFLPQAI